MTKLERPVVAAIFYSLLAYRLTEKSLFKLEEEFDDDMKFGKNPIKMT